MAEITYLNFDLRIEPWQGGYRSRVGGSPVGDGAAAPFVPPAEALRPDSDTTAKELRAFGQQLFRAAFEDEVLGALRRSQDEAQRRGVTGLRVRLHLTDVPELAGLPWEYLCDPVGDQFLCLHTATPVVRYLDLPQRIRPLAVEPPLRILALIASPGDQPALDAEAEWTRLREAVATLEKNGQVELERIDAATLPALQQRLRHGRYHVLHYVGHGGFDETSQEGRLILEDGEGRSWPVSGQMLGTLLLGERGLRLVVLNACEGGRASRDDPFAGVAQSLVRKGIPAVIAMQDVISDQAAATFAQEFYTVLAERYPVDAALTEARLRIYSSGNEREWGTPVLYLRAPDGRIFDLPADEEWAVVEAEDAPVAVEVPSPEATETPVQLPACEPAYTERNRPAMGGDSIGHYRGGAATFGCLVVDRDDPASVYILCDTNGFCPPGARIGDPVVQPGPADGGSLADAIATLARWSLLYDDPARAADNVPAAVARVGRLKDVGAQLRSLGYLQGVRSAYPGMEVFAVGRTGGVVQGKVLRVGAYQQVAIPFDLLDPASLDGTGAGSEYVSVLLADMIETSPMMRPGDCGMVLVDRENHAVGLGFAGDSTFSLFIPMRQVLNTLNVDLVTQDVWLAMRNAGLG